MNFYIICFFSLISIFLNYIFYFNSNLSFYALFIDEVSLFMSFLAVVVIFLSFFSVSSLIHSSTLIFMSAVILLRCLGVFSTSNLLYLYIYFELSLVPIIFIIIKWGIYPERSLRSIIMLIYTSIFTIPFIYVLLSFYSVSFSLNLRDVLFSLPYEPSKIFRFFFFLTFCVKLPIYGLHFWLPMAHVEAPTFGSIILAGVLLKLGGVSLIRVTHIIDINFLKSLFFGYFLVFLVYSTLLCCLQSDFKRLIAYSSVSHIIVIPLMYFSLTLLGFKGILTSIIFHGLSSPLIFILVGVVYRLYNSRQLIFVRGLLLVSPFLSFLLVLGFFFNLSAPPFPSFITEIFFRVCLIKLWIYRIFFLFFFFIISLLYNLSWFSSILFLKPSLGLRNSYLIPFRSFLVSLILAIFLPILLVFLFNQLI